MQHISYTSQSQLLCLYSIHLEPLCINHIAASLQHPQCTTNTYNIPVIHVVKEVTLCGGSVN